MIYSNKSSQALYAMENAHYGNDFDEEEPVYAKCPVCGEKTDYYGFYTLYRNCSGKIIGCNQCVMPVDEYGQEILLKRSYI